MASADYAGIDDYTKFQRFINFGSEDGLYIPGERSLGRENSQLFARLVSSGKGEDLVSDIVNHCGSRKPVKHLACVFALASCARSLDLKTKHAAYKALPSVCQTSTDLFAFVGFAQMLCSDTKYPHGEESKRPRPTGWGRAQRKAISDWYNSKDPKQLAEDVTKYKQRNGWSHVDLLRLSHTKPTKDGISAVLKYAVKGLDEVRALYPGDDATDDMKVLLQYLEAVDTVKHSSDDHQVARLVEQHRLSKEHVPTGLLKSKEVWLALISTMPFTDVLHSLGKLASLGLLESDSETTDRLIDRLKDETDMVQARVHPFSVLVAWKVYEQGRGEKGRLKWIPNVRVQEALNTVFYNSFKSVQATNKKYVLGISITGSLSIQAGLNGTPAVSAAVAAATMALVTARTETDYQLVVFSSELQQVVLNRQMQLLDICRAMSEESTKIPLGLGNLCLPITWAMETKRKVDVFIIYTDARASSNTMSPLQALKDYRQKVNPRAKLVLCGMAPSTLMLGAGATHGALDIVNFDSTAPDIINNFIHANL